MWYSALVVTFYPIKVSRLNTIYLMYNVTGFLQNIVKHHYEIGPWFNNSTTHLSVYLPRCIFNSVYDIRLEQLPLSFLPQSATSSPEKSYHSGRERHSPMRSDSSAAHMSHQQSRMTLGESMIGGGGIQSEYLMQAVAVISKETEVLQLDEEVSA